VRKDIENNTATRKIFIDIGGGSKQHTINQVIWYVAWSWSVTASFFY
jgi:hypothetical protein